VILVAYLLLGRLIIWAIAVAKPTRWLWSFFEGCDFCLGMWVYLALAFWFPLHLADLWAPLPYVPVLTQFMTGLLAAYVMHVLVIGFKAKFYAIPS
jgi:hypothetical protein